jgi:N-acetylneuraminic acid mutarotase
MTPAKRSLAAKRAVLIASVACVAAAGAGCRSGGGASVIGTAPPQGSWRSEAPMTFARAAHAVVSTPAAIYALAGTGASGTPVLTVERFDGKRWTAETTLPGAGLNAPAAVVLDGRIYLIGGFNTTTNVPTDLVQVYDPATHSWSEAAPLPAPRGGHAAAVLDGKIHVIGGGNSRSTLADHSVYDPATNRWSSLAPLPRSEGSPAAVVAGGKLFALGGRSGPSDFGAVDIYDPATDRWSAGPAITPRGTAGAVVYCGAIYLVGGESQARNESLADLLRLDLDTFTWHDGPRMPTARNFARAVTFNGRMFVVGGSPTPGQSHASEGSTVVESFFNAPCFPMVRAIL